MRGLLEKFDLSRAESAGGRFVLPQLAIKLFHQIGGGLIVNRPETDQNGRCSSGKEAARQSDQFLAGCDQVNSRFTGAERHQTTIESQIRRVPDGKPAVL